MRIDGSPGESIGSRFTTRNGLQIPAQGLPWTEAPTGPRCLGATFANPSPSWRAWSAFARLRSFISTVCGGAMATSSSRPSNGSGGSATIVYSKRPPTSLRLSRRSTLTSRGTGNPARFSAPDPRARPVGLTATTVLLPSSIPSITASMPCFSAGGSYLSQDGSDPAWCCRIQIPFPQFAFGSTAVPEGDEHVAAPQTSQSRETQRGLHDGLGYHILER